mmetsp:Transcript_9040/g.22068  ORF Transcript_9040/g.22068 Transcript_9040/m.22068 type:complete len:209 (-) Transcript_9040:465-1091(-)
MPTSLCALTSSTGILGGTRRSIGRLLWLPYPLPTLPPMMGVVTSIDDFSIIIIPPPDSSSSSGDVRPTDEEDRMPSAMRVAMPTTAFPVALRDSSSRSSVSYCAQRLRVGVTTFATAASSVLGAAAEEEEEFDLLADARPSEERVVVRTGTSLLYSFPSAPLADAVVRHGRSLEDDPTEEDPKERWLPPNPAPPAFAAHELVVERSER